MTIQLVEYDEFRKEMAEVEDTCNFLPDVATMEGYEKSKRVSLDVGKVLIRLEKKRVELKKESLDKGRLIDSDAKSIVADLEVFQLPHKEAYKELDNLKKEREAQRKTDLDERVREIRELPEAMQDSDSEGIKMALESLQCEDCLDFYEYTEQALKARNSSRETLSKMFSDTLKQEKDAVELEELRIKQAKQEQKDRDDRIAKAAAAEADQKAEKAKLAERKAIESANEAVRQREESEEKARQDAIDAEKLSKQRALEAAEKAKEDAERGQIEIIKKEKAAIQRREADKKNVGKIRKEAKESLMAAGLNEESAKKIVLAIGHGDIKHVSITY